MYHENDSSMDEDDYRVGMAWSDKISNDDRFFVDIRR
jgi:hypothetical protein